MFEARIQALVFLHLPFVHFWIHRSLVVPLELDLSVSSRPSVFLPKLETTSSVVLSKLHGIPKPIRDEDGNRLKVASLSQQDVLALLLTTVGESYHIIGSS